MNRRAIIVFDKRSHMAHSRRSLTACPTVSAALSAVLAAAGLLAGCTTTDEIIIDERGVDMARYRQDLVECQSYSEQVKTGEKAARGAASGAVVGGLIGAAAGNSDDAQRGAGVGAVAGGARGVSRGVEQEVRVVKQCLRGRGYRVLN